MSVKKGSDYSQKFSTVPWTPEELRNFWASAKLTGIDREQVREIVRGHYHKSSLRDLTRPEWEHLLVIVSQYARPRRRAILSTHDPRHGRASDGQWARIRWLQGLLGWTDGQRDAYIRKHGHIDSIRFMTVDIARAVITGMHKILDWQERKQDRGYQ